MDFSVGLLRARRNVVVVCAYLVALQPGIAVAAQGAHCQPEVAGVVSVTESELVDSLDIGPRKSAERGVVRYRACSATYGGSLPPRPAGRERLPLPFASPDSFELATEGRRVLGQLASAIQSDSLIEFAFRVEVRVESRGDQQADLALSVKRAESVIAILTVEHGLPASRFKAVGLGGTDSAARANVSFVTQRQRR